MHTPNEQLAELLSLTAENLSQLTEALTTYSFEMMASSDPAVRIASRRMVSRVAMIQSALGHQQHLVSALTGIASSTSSSVIELEVHAPLSSDLSVRETG